MSKNHQSLSTSQQDVKHSHHYSAQNLLHSTQSHGSNLALQGVGNWELKKSSKPTLGDQRSKFATLHARNFHHLSSSNTTTSKATSLAGEKLVAKPSVEQMLDQPTYEAHPDTSMKKSPGEVVEILTSDPCEDEKADDIEFDHQVEEFRRDRLALNPMPSEFSQSQHEGRREAHYHKSKIQSEISNDLDKSNLSSSGLQKQQSIVNQMNKSSDYFNQSREKAMSTKTRPALIGLSLHPETKVLMTSAEGMPSNEQQNLRESSEIPRNPTLQKTISRSSEHPYSEKVLPEVIEEEDLMMPGDFKKEKYEIKIGQTTIDFEMKDPIFTLSGPTAEHKAGAKCSCCSKDLKSKSPHYCEFCGYRYCEKCLHKTRSFKRSQFSSGQRSKSDLRKSGLGQSLSHSAISKRSEQTRGRVCKICDNKFMMYQLYSKHFMQMEENDEHIEILAQQYHEIQQEGRAKEKELRLLESKLHGETQDLKDVQTKCKIKIQALRLDEQDLKSTQPRYQASLLEKRRKLAELREQKEELDAEFSHEQAKLVHERSTLHDLVRKNQEADDNVFRKKDRKMTQLYMSELKKSTMEESKESQTQIKSHGHTSIGIIKSNTSENLAFKGVATNESNTATEVQSSEHTSNQHELQKLMSSMTDQEKFDFLKSQMNNLQKSQDFQTLVNTLPTNSEEQTSRYRASAMPSDKTSAYQGPGERARQNSCSSINEQSSELKDSTHSEIIRARKKTKAKKKRGCCFQKAEDDEQ